MFCPECGKQTPEESMNFCPFCGHELRVVKEKIRIMNIENDGEVEDTLPKDHFKDNYNFRTNSGTFAHEMPMGWYKFLINFSLVFGAITNFITGIVYLVGGHYNVNGTNYSAAVYKAFPDLQGMDIFMAVCLFALGCYAIWIRYMLAEYKEGSPSHLIAMQIFSIIASIFYLVAVIGIIGEDMGSEVTSPATFSILVSVVMAIVNYFYFAKRQDLFVN